MASDEFTADLAKKLVSSPAFQDQMATAMVAVLREIVGGERIYIPKRKAASHQKAGPPSQSRQKGGDPDRLSELAGSGKSFSMSRSVDMMHKLDWEIRSLTRTPPLTATERGYATLNAATTAWHVKDWVFAELKANPRLKRLAEHRLGEPVPGASKFGELIAKASPALHVCSQLAAASKHAHVTKEADPSVRTARVLVPVQGRPETSRFDIEIRDEHQSWAPLELLRQAQSFWSEFIAAVELSAEDDPEPMAGVIENVVNQLFEDRAARTREG